MPKQLQESILGAAEDPILEVVSSTAPVNVPMVAVSLASYKPSTLVVGV